VGGGESPESTEIAVVTRPDSTVLFLQTRNSLALQGPAACPPISSRNSVPPSDCHDLPLLACEAPVKAPLAWPKRFGLQQVGGWPPVDADKNGFLASYHSCWCVLRANFSLCRYLNRRAASPVHQLRATWNGRSALAIHQGPGLVTQDAVGPASLEHRPRRRCCDVDGWFSLTKMCGLIDHTETELDA